MTEPTDTADFERVTLPFLPDVRRYALRLSGNASDADDLVQATYLNALRGWHTFRPGSDGRKWLFAICRNYFLRQRQRTRETVSLDPPELDSLEATRLSKYTVDAIGHQWMESPDLGPAIDRAIAALPEHYRMAVMLVDVEGWSYEDAAREESIPIGTLRSRLFRGRRILQEQLVAHARDRKFTTAGSDG